MAMNSSTKFYSLFGSVFFLFAGYGLFLNSAGVKLAQMGVNNIAIGALNAAFFVGAALSAVVAHRISDLLRVIGRQVLRGFRVAGRPGVGAPQRPHLGAERLVAQLQVLHCTAHERVLDLGRGRAPRRRVVQRGDRFSAAVRRGPGGDA